MTKTKRLVCWLCVRESITKSSAANGTCPDHRAVLAEETFCRSSAPCSERAGHGRWGQFCEAHAAELAACSKPSAKWNGRARASAEPEQRQRVPRDETAVKVAAVVKAAD